MAVCYKIGHICTWVSDKGYVATDWLAHVQHWHKGMTVGMIAIPILFYIVRCILI
jgi:hypothetical protein